MPKPKPKPGPLPSAGPDSTGTGSTGADRQEILLLRAQLQALAELGAVTAPGTPTAPASGQALVELELLRGQLKALATLVAEAGGGRPTPPVPFAAPWQAEETQLLRGILGAALEEMDRAASRLPPPAPLPAPPPATPGMAEIEAAIARLLSDLVQETDRRIRAETEAMQARATLRAHGLEDRPAPHRRPVAPRQI